MTPPRRTEGGLAMLFSLVLLATASAHAQISPQVENEIKQQAASLASQPVRLALRLPSKEVAAGSTTNVRVTLVSADNKSVPANRDWQVSVEVQLPSGAKTTQRLLIPRGQTSEDVQISSKELGLASITASPTTPGIRPARTDFLVLPANAAPQSTAAAKQKPNSYLIPPRNRREESAALAVTARFQTVRFEPPGGSGDPGRMPGSPAVRRNSPRLHISVDNAGSDFIANGSDPAVISAYFESPDGKPAPRNINVWFTFTRGSLSPGALEIPKGSYSGATDLTSNWPGDVHVAFVNSNPTYPAEGSTEFDVQFVPLGVVLAGPDKLSVIDSVPVLVVFVNDRGPIAPGWDWPVTLRTSQSKLALTPVSLIVKGDSPLGSAMLLPRSVGSDTIEAVVSDYEPLPLPVVITWRAVLVLCLGGGVLGGIAAYQQFRGSWFWRVFLGLVGGAFFSWLYVFLALPTMVGGNLVGNIAHNTISVFFVSIIGGYMGTRALDFSARKLGWLT
jgi:hypothetical protein